MLCRGQRWVEAQGCRAYSEFSVQASRVEGLAEPPDMPRAHALMIRERLKRSAGLGFRSACPRILTLALELSKLSLARSYHYL